MVIDLMVIHGRNVKIQWYFIRCFIYQYFVKYYSFVPNCKRGAGGVEKMHKGQKYQDFLKCGELFLGHSLVTIKWT